MSSTSSFIWDSDITDAPSSSLQTGHRWRLSVPMLTFSWHKALEFTKQLLIHSCTQTKKHKMICCNTQSSCKSAHVHELKQLHLILQEETKIPCTRVSCCSVSVFLLVAPLSCSHQGSFCVVSKTKQTTFWHSMIVWKFSKAVEALRVIVICW